MLSFPVMELFCYTGSFDIREGELVKDIAGRFSRFGGLDFDVRHDEVADEVVRGAALLGGLCFEGAVGGFGKGYVDVELFHGCAPAISRRRRRTR